MGMNDSNSVTGVVIVGVVLIGLICSGASGWGLLSMERDRAFRLAVAQEQMRDLCDAEANAAILATLPGGPGGVELAVSLGKSLAVCDEVLDAAPSATVNMVTINQWRARRGYEPVPRETALLLYGTE
jgi:hypothetical protein